MTWRLELESVGTYWTDLTGSGAFDENTLNYVEVKYTSINLYAGGRIDIPYWFAATGAGVHIPGGVPSGFWAAL